MKIFNYALFLTLALVAWVVTSMIPDGVFVQYARGVVIAVTGFFIMFDVLERQQG